MKRKQTYVSKQVLKKSKEYVANNPKPVTESEVKDGSASSNSNLRKATPSDKERKRAKRKLKKQMQKEAKQNKEKEEVGKVAKLAALSYLRLWHKTRSEWTFKKKRQLWLLTHVYSVDDIADDDFKIMLNHIIGLQGGAKDRLIKESEKVIQHYEANEPENTEESEECPDREASVRIFERAKGVLQMLV